jgi:hypothetical protein
MAALASIAGAQVQPILWSDGPLPGGPADATLRVNSGIFRPQWSPNKQNWVVRVDRSSGSGDEYLVSGSGATGTAIVHSRASASTSNPSTLPGVFSISERGLSINDSGEVAFSGGFAAAATTDTIWKYSPATPGAVEIVAREGNATYQRPDGLGNFVDIGGPSITNLGQVAFPDVSSTNDVVSLWTGGTSYTQVAKSGVTTFVNAPGRTLQNVATPEANLQRGSVFYFQPTSGTPTFGLLGDLNDAPATDDFFLAVGDTIVAREGQVIDGLPAQSATVVGRVDAAGNWYVLSTQSANFAVINGTKVLNAGEPVNGSVAGETWAASGSVFGVATVFALDRNAAGGYIIGSETTNTGVVNAQVANQVLIYVDPQGNRTELLRKGDLISVERDPDGAGPLPPVAVQRVVNQFSSSARAHSAWVDDTHAYVVFTATRNFDANDVGSSVAGEVLARIALPAPPAPTGACCVAGVCTPASTAAACAVSGGAYQGDASVCSPDPCPVVVSVVCCRGSTCALVLPAECLPGVSPVVGATVGVGIACNAAGDSVTPCCYADFNKAGGVTIDDIFIYLNAWFASSEFANVGEPGAPNIDDIFIYLNAWFAGCPTP